MKPFLVITLLCFFAGYVYAAPQCTKFETASALQNSNQYDIKNRCFIFSGELFQLLNKSQGLYSLFGTGTPYAFIDFGNVSAQKTYYEPVKGKGAYTYTSAIGAVMIVHKLEMVSAIEQETYDAQLERQQMEYKAEQAEKEKMKKENEKLEAERSKLIIKEDEERELQEIAARRELDRIDFEKQVIKAESMKRIKAAEEENRRAKANQEENLAQSDKLYLFNAIKGKYVNSTSKFDKSLESILDIKSVSEEEAIFSIKHSARGRSCEFTNLKAATTYNANSSIGKIVLNYGSAKGTNIYEFGKNPDNCSLQITFTEILDPNISADYPYMANIQQHGMCKPHCKESSVYGVYYKK